jgi:hypothetical protein
MAGVWQNLEPQAFRGKILRNKELAAGPKRPTVKVVVRSRMFPILPVPLFSVKVVRHKQRIFVSGGLWKSVAEHSDFSPFEQGQRLGGSRGFPTAFRLKPAVQAASCPTLQKAQGLGHPQFLYCPAKGGASRLSRD